MMMGSILIAEAHAPTRYLRARVLTDAGYSILESGCAAGTVSAIVDGGPAIGLVLLDVGLPDGNGFDVCSQIKAIRPDLPVVLISAVYRTAHARREGLVAGADAYVVEPTPPARLVKLIGALTTAGQATAESPRALFGTTKDGIIIWANEQAAALVNIGVRAVQGRDLLAFFNGDRARVRTEMASAAAGQVCDFDASLRPRERKPFSVRVDVAAALDQGPSELEWTIEA
jgi:DNA-binding response OmpR family regulator